jgi:hypothetical protein
MYNLPKTDSGNLCHVAHAVSKCNARSKQDSTRQHGLAFSVVSEFPVALEG